MEIKGLLYPSEVESSEEVVAMITHIESTQVEPLVVQGVASETGKILVEVTTAKPLVLTSRL